MQIFPGDILFVWGNGPIDHIIEGVTDGPSHCALFIDENTVAEAQGLRPIGSRPLSFYTSGDGRLEVWQDTTLTEAERTEMVRYAKTKYGSPYDYALLLLEFAHFELDAKLTWYHENRHLICSNYLDVCASHLGRKWSQVPNPAPVDLIRGGALQKKGDLN